MKYFFILMFIIEINCTDSFYCRNCKKIQSNLIDIIKIQSKRIFSTANILCNLGGSVKLCKYFVFKFGKLLLNKKKDFLERTNYICANVFRFCPLEYKQFDFEKFRQEIHQKYPIKKQNNKQEKYKPFTALVLTDVHAQRDYAYKSKINCNDPAGCCYENDIPEGPHDEAGYWGQFNCDIPKRTYEEALNQIKNLSTDFVFLLGDNYGHNYFRDDSIQDLWDGNKYFYQKIQENLSDRIVIPVLGNHEGDPVDHFDFNDKNNDVIQNIFSEFERFIHKDKIKDLIENGFYEIEYSEYNLKIISLNSQLGDRLNVYNVNTNTDILDFIHKLSQSLYNSEQKNQKVIILSHIPVKQGTLVEDYTKAYQIIIDRFQDTITSLISGHTHNDELQFIKNDKDEYIHCNFIVSSLTTDGNHNPSFRIFEFNEQTQFKDYIHYRANLEYYNNLYNNNNKSIIQFDPIYRFKEEYGIQNWNQKNDYQNFINRFNFDENLQMKYISNIKNQYIDPDWRNKFLEAKCGLIAQTPSDEQVCQGQLSFDYYNFLFQHPWLEKIKK